MTPSEARPLRIVALRADISALSGVIAQLRRAGLDNAAVQLLLARKRAELDGLTQSATRQQATPTKPAQP